MHIKVIGFWSPTPEVARSVLADHPLNRKLAKNTLQGQVDQLEIYCKLILADQFLDSFKGETTVCSCTWEKPNLLFSFMVPCSFFLVRLQSSKPSWFLVPSSLSDYSLQNLSCTRLTILAKIDNSPNSKLGKCWVLMHSLTILLLPEFCR